MPEVAGGRYTVQVGWRDIPHLSEQAKEEMLLSVPPYLRGARMRGEPVLGRGRIYDIDIEDLTYEPFKIPPGWPRVYALDPGWGRTAALWAAWDRTADVIYLYSEYYMGQRPPLVHAAAIKAHGKWIPGVMDPSARNRKLDDGERMIDLFAREGLELYPADNAVDTGIEDCYGRMATGRLKVSRALQNFRFEYSIYRRDENGKIVKAHDHLLDCMRYIVNSGLEIAKTETRATVNRWSQAGVADREAGF